MHRREPPSAPPTERHPTAAVRGNGPHPVRPPRVYLAVVPPRLPRSPLPPKPRSPRPSCSALLHPFPSEVMRSSKRDLTNATRGIERDIASLQQEEKKLVAEIKRTAKTGNEAATKILARQLIRLRQQISNLQGSQAQIRGIATHTQAMHANTSVATGLQSASKAMGALNKQMEPTKQMKIMKEFQKQSAQMDMTNEMMSDSIDDVLDDDQAEEETEELANQVLDEIGVDIASQLSSAPKGKIAGKKVQVDESSELEELEKRLAALKNP